jgi:hypothetical protein
LAAFRACTATDTRIATGSRRVSAADETLRNETIGGTIRACASTVLSHITDTLRRAADGRGGFKRIRGAKGVTPITNGIIGAYATGRAHRSSVSDTDYAGGSVRVTEGHATSIIRRTLNLAAIQCHDGIGTELLILLITKR